MDLYMCRVAQAASEEDVKIALAKILHKPPFPHDPPLNFDLFLYKKYDSRGKHGILSLPDERVAQAFLRAYGQSIVIKGSRITISPSKKAVDLEKLERIRNTPWRDPEQLQAEKEQRICEGRPHELVSYAFGDFLADGSFSAECTVEGAADIACDLERRQVRFTLRKQSQSSVSDSRNEDFITMMNLLLTPTPPLITVSYQLATIDSIVDSHSSERPILFIRANAFPIFAVEMSNLTDRVDSRRSQGLIPGTPMPPGAFQLMCTFKNMGDKDTFIHACKTRFHLRHTRKQTRISVRDNTSNFTPPNLDVLKEFRFEVAFELEKAMVNRVLSFGDVQSLRASLDNLCQTHGDAAPSIFRRFIALLEDEGRPRRRHRRNRNAPASMTLEGRLNHAVELYLEEQARPRGRLQPALDSPAISYSYHMILTPTRHILEGPVTDQSNSVLRRFGHHDCFLRVSFQDENRSKLRRDLETSITDLLSERYRPVLLKGCKVAGRHYQMLGYSMSGLKEHSLWFVRPFLDDQGRQMDAQTIRESLGDFSRLLYQPARLGARWSQAFSATDPSITLEPEEIEQIPDIKSRRTGKVMTDGCSPISPELAEVIWRANQRTKRHPARGKVPSALQYRLGGAKGMVLQDHTLEGRVVQLRPSQIKFDAPDNRTFDIQSTSKRPKPMFLNRPLIVLLEYLRSSQERIIELQHDSIDEAQSIHQSFSNASKVLQQHGLGSSFHLQSLLRNMSSILNLKTPKEEGDEGDLWLSNDLINSALHCAETHVLRELKYRAHIAVPGSFTLLGVSDEWDCLKEGEIYATVHDERTGLEQEITGTVAITRSPQIHPGDVQVVTAVRRPELQHLTNVVVFSCRGDRSLSSCLGGGDLDGDDFNLILDPELIPETISRPGDYVSLPIKRTEHPCGIEDVVDFIFDYIEADLVGHIAISHLRFSDRADPSCEPCLKLAELASQAVDFPKTGTPVKFQDLPKPQSRMKPDFLAREGADLNSEMYYRSDKLLGELFRRVPLKNWMPGEWTGQESPSGGDVVEQALGLVGLYGLGLGVARPTDELHEEMEYLLDDYCKQLMAIAKTHTISKNKDIHISEAELVSGTIMANWSDHHRRREAVGAMNLQTHELVRAVRAEMRGTTATAHEESEQEEYTDDGRWWDDDDEDEYFRETRFVTESFKRGWAGWCVAEDALRDDPGSFGPQSFGLIALGRMLELIKAARLLL